MSHVQNNRRRHEAEVSQRSKPWSKFITTLSPSNGLETSQLDGAKLKFLDYDKTIQSSKSAANDQKQQKMAEQRQSPAPASPKSLSMAMKPSYNASDPFHCTAAHLDAGTHAILHITFSHASRTNFLAESFAPPSKILQTAPMRHDRMFQLRLRRCVVDEKLIYSTLAYGSCLLGWMMDRFHSAKQPEYFLDKALRAVRAYLSTPGYIVDDWLLLSMYALAITEMWNGLPTMWKQSPKRHAMASSQGSRGFAACRMHLKALLQVVNEAGGWERFDPYVLDSVILADKYLAISEGKPPVIPITWDPGPLPFALREELGITTQSILPRLGTGLLLESLSEELDNVLQDLIAYCRIASQAWSGSPIGPEAECWLFRRSQAIACRLLLHIHNEHTNHLERCISYASLTFIFTCIPARGPQVSAQHTTAQLHILLQEEGSSKEDAKMPKDLRFWLLFMGSVVSEPSPHRLWFLEQMTEHCDGGEITESNFGGRLEPYLFLPSRQGARIPSMIEHLNSMIGDEQIEHQFE
ncbi:hypothetical protein ACHAQJ_006593 [Trichoderma viride]